MVAQSGPMDRRGFDRHSVVSDLRAELEQACADLVYSSESDRPFEFFSVPFAGEHAPSIDDFRALLGIEPNTLIETRSLNEFFARHLGIVDPTDTRAIEIRPRYDALTSLLGRRLEGVKVFRVGKIAIACYIVGRPGPGTLAGLRTVAIET